MYGISGGTPGKGGERLPEKAGPIRPQGVSRQLPFLLAVGLIIALYAGYSYLVESDLFRTAERFVRQNQELKGAVGEVHSCRPWYPLTVHVRQRRPVVRLTVAVDGAAGSTKVAVTLVRREKMWEVTAASYEDAQGRMRPLLRAEK